MRPFENRSPSVGGHLYGAVRDTGSQSDTRWAMVRGGRSSQVQDHSSTTDAGHVDFCFPPVDKSLQGDPARSVHTGEQSDDRSGSCRSRRWRRFLGMG